MTRPARLLAVPTLVLSALGLALFPTAAGAAPLALPARASDAALATKVAAVLKDSRVTTATVGVLVAEASSGTELYGRSVTTAISPASNMKLLTAAAALDLLGPNRTFSTEVDSAARPVNGAVGSLYLRGNGDPTLREADLKSLVEQVKAAGVTRVTGSVIADAGYFDQDKYNDYWDASDYSYSYAPQIQGLTMSPSSAYKVGTILVRYRPGAAKGAKALLSVVPAAAKGYVTLVNKTTTTSAGSGSTISVRRKDLTNTITVSGRVALKRAAVDQVVTVRYPALYTAHVFTNLLRAAGISVTGTAKAGSLPSTRTMLATDTSAPLSTIVSLLLKPSNNGMAETLIKTIGRVDGRAGTWAAGAAAIKRWLGTTQAVPSNVVIRDGSGLARSDKLTARVIVRLLQYARSRPWFASFYAALPVAGNPDPAVGGTLTERMVGTAAQNNLRAKTGTLSGVTALSGYVTDRSGRLYTFSMLGRYSGSSPRIVFDEVGATLAGWTS